MGYVDLRFIGGALRERLAESTSMIDVARGSAVMGVACGALALLLLAGVA